MIIVRLYPSRITDLYILVQDDDWELGMPEGLAHWNGTHWEWIRRFEHSHTRSMKLVDGHLFLLDFDGRIQRRNPDGEWESDKAPNFGYLAMTVSSPSEMLVVGRGGAFLQLQSGRWHPIQTDTTEALNYIHGTPPDCFICGSKGVLLRFDGSRCHRLETGTTGSLTHIEIGRASCRER